MQLPNVIFQLVLCVSFPKPNVDLLQHNSNFQFHPKPMPSNGINSTLGNGFPWTISLSLSMAICILDRIPSTTPGAEPPRDAKDSGSARSHSTHLETSSSDRPEMVTYMEPHTVPTYMSVKCTRRTLLMPSFTRAPHAQPSLSNFTRRDSDFGEPIRSRGTTRLERNFPTSPKNKKTKLTHRSLYMSLRTISTPHVN